AALRSRRKDSPAAVLTHQGLEVERRLEAQEAEPEAVLPAGLAVAAAGVAAQLGKDRNHLVRKVDRPAGGKLGHLYGHFGRERTRAHENLRLAIAPGGQPRTRV